MEKEERFSLYPSLSLLKRKRRLILRASTTTTTMMLTTTTTTRVSTTRRRRSGATSTIGSRGSGSGKGQQRRAPLSRKRGTTSTTAASAIGKVTAAPAINDNDNSTHELVFLCAREAMERARQKTKDDESTGSSILDQCNLQSAHVFTLAATTMVDKKMVALITQSVASFIKLYLLLLFVRVLLTWFPNVNWMRQPWTMLRQVTDPYLNLFRNLIPPIMGQIDFTPILGFMVLQFLARVLSTDPSLGRF